MNILVELQGRPVRCFLNFLKWACQSCVTWIQTKKSQSIAQCPNRDPQTSRKPTKCNESENPTVQEEEGSTQNGFLRLLWQKLWRCLCFTLFSISLVIWFPLDLIGLNITWLKHQVRFAWGSFGYIALGKSGKERSRAAANQCAIFFVVRDEADSNDIEPLLSLQTQLKQQIESLDARMHIVEKTVGRMDSKTEILIETGFAKMRELISGTTQPKTRFQTLPNMPPRSEEFHERELTRPTRVRQRWDRQSQEDRQKGKIAAT